MERVAVIIEGRQFANWQSLSLTYGLDVVATIALSAPFEPDRAEFWELFKPLDFTPIEVQIGGRREFAGTMVDVGPSFDASSTRVEVSGYALPGVLGDCDPPVTALPFEWKNVGLKTIAEAVCAPFGLEVDFRLGDDPPFERVAFDPLEEAKKPRGKNVIDEAGKPWEFLGKLAKQRNAVLSSTADGKLLIWRAVTGDSVATLEGGLPPLIAVTPNFRPQEYHSEITGFAPAKRGHKGGKYTAKNDRLPSRVIRPHHFRCDDGEDADVPLATRSKLGRMFGAAVSFTVEGIPTWRDPKGNLWRPNTLIRLKAPRAMIYDYTNLLIRSVALHQTDKSEVADLQVCFPQAFTGEIPKRFPWGARVST